MINKTPLKTVNVSGKNVAIFELGKSNIDNVTVESFGEEWSKFDSFSEEEINNVGNEYFDIVDFEGINAKDMTALDAGCGTGRWSIYLSKKVKDVYAIDPSKAIFSAAELTKNIPNIHLVNCSIDDMPFENESFDFVFSLGVLHHIPDTQQALKDLVTKLKPGGYCLIYLYYSLDNRGVFYKLIFHLSSLFRFVISKLPKTPKKLVCDLIAFTVYLPFVGLSKLVSLIFGKKLGNKIPLAYYTDKTINVIRNDALDRFGTPLEQRFSKIEIQKMMENVGMKDIKFSNNQPYWHVIGKKK